MLITICKIKFFALLFHFFKWYNIFFLIYDIFSQLNNEKNVYQTW